MSITPIPWVRVTHHESLGGEHRSERTRLRAVDVVHKDFLADYLTQHVAQFAKDFGTLALKHQLVIADCAAFASGMGKDSWDNIEARLKQKSLATGVSRVRSVGRNVLKRLRKKGAH